MAKSINFFKEFLWAQPVNEMIQMLDEAGGEDISVDLFTYGGETQPTWTLYKRVKRYEGNTNVEVDGIAASMGSVLLTSFDKVGISDTGKIMIHAPSGGDGMGETKNELTNSLYEALKSKIDEQKFKEVTGYKLKDVIFAEGDKRKDIWLNAKQAKQIGLADYTYKLTSSKAKNVIDFANSTKNYSDQLNMNALAACLKETENINNNNQKTKKMTYDELKQNHPSLFEKIRNEGIEAGEKKERSRVKAALAWIEVDQKAVVEKISNGDDIDVAFNNQMQVKMIKQTKLQASKEEDPGSTDTNPIKDKVKKDEVSEEVKNAASDMLERFGINKK